MTSLPPSYSLTDRNEWQADPLPQIDARLRNCIYSSEWLSDAPSPFDVQHEETARLYETSSGVSPTILGPFDPEQPRKSIPPDRTVLCLFEKRAVIVAGERCDSGRTGTTQPTTGRTAASMPSPRGPLSAI